MTQHPSNQSQFEQSAQRFGQMRLSQAADLAHTIRNSEEFRARFDETGTLLEGQETEAVNETNPLEGEAYETPRKRTRMLYFPIDGLVLGRNIEEPEGISYQRALLHIGARDVSDESEQREWNELSQDFEFAYNQRRKLPGGIANLSTTQGVIEIFSDPNNSVRGQRYAAIHSFLARNDSVAIQSPFGYQRKLGSETESHVIRTGLDLHVHSKDSGDFEEPSVDSKTIQFFNSREPSTKNQDITPHFDPRCANEK